VAVALVDRTVAVLGNGWRKYYGLPYSRMTNDSGAESSVSDLWNSLMACGPSCAAPGDLETVLIAAIGMGLARLSGQISQADVIRLIVISFLTSSWEMVVASHLLIVLVPGSAEKADLQRGSGISRRARSVTPSLAHPISGGSGLPPDGRPTRRCRRKLPRYGIGPQH
jgi:hypothetical protein